MMKTTLYVRLPVQVLLVTTFLILGTESSVSQITETPYQNPLFSGPVRDTPVRHFDQEHLRLQLAIDAENQTIAGSASLRVRPVRSSNSLLLFASDLEIDSVLAGPVAGPLSQTEYHTKGDSLIVALDTLGSWGIAAESSLEIQIFYQASPRRGLYFTSRPGVRGANRFQVWSQGEPDENRYWFPVFDHPEDKLTTELIITIKPSLKVLSNGYLVNQTENSNGTATYHYAQNKPHSPYLVMIAAGDYTVIHDSVHLEDGSRVPLEYWVYPDRADEVDLTFGRTPEMMQFFSDKLDVPFPWTRYAQVVVRDFIFGGMENTGATTLTDNVLVDERASMDYDPDGLIAHELAHQWFGDYVTMRDWSHIWLNEGLATYLDALFVEYENGKDAFDLDMLANKTRYLAESSRYRRPLVWNKWEDPINLFDGHSYQKGAWVLHMLRETVGYEVFWDILEEYLWTHPYGSVETRDLKDAAEVITGQSFDRFFEDWVMKAGHPVLEASYEYDPAAGELILNVRQVQEGDLVPDVFQLNLDVEVQTLTETNQMKVEMDRRQITARLPLDSQPRYVLLDPHHKWLMETRIDQPVSAWVAQLRYAPGLVSRIEAARALRNSVDDPALFVALQNALREEPVSSVRAEIVETMAAFPPTTAIERTLLEQYPDETPEVREAILVALRAFPESPEVARLVLNEAQNSRSYNVQAAAVLTLAHIGADQAEDVVRAALITPSHRNVIRTTAFEALPLLDMIDSDAIALGLEYSNPESEHPAEVIASALRFLAHYAGQDERVSGRIMQSLSDPRTNVRRAAIQAVSQTQDARFLSTLENTVETEPDGRLRALLHQTINELQTGP